MKKRHYIIFIGLMLIYTNKFSQDIFLNEIMSSNIKSIIDEDGDSSDWIELQNNTDQTISLLDFGLTDDIDNPFKWKFPNVRLLPSEVFVVYASGKNKTEWFTNWETIINQGDDWEFKIGDESIPQDWFSLNYFSNWDEGKSGFGYGDNDDVTILESNTVSVFLRKEFEITDITDIQAAIFHIDYDDGFVAYLNGVEIVRRNLGVVGELVVYNDLATSSLEPNIVFGKTPEQFRISNSILREGNNILAIQIHNNDSTSSDLTAIPFFSISRESNTNYEYNTPDVLGSRFINLHTNFSISSSGEEIILTNKYGDAEDAIVVPELLSDVTYGRSTEENKAWGIFYDPTPWEQNYTEIFSQIADKPKYSKKSGFYSEPFFLEFENIAKEIYFTKDGSDPDLSSQYYSTPVLINKTMVIRAKLYDNNSLPSEVVTKTYFINEKTDLPVISISTAPENLWDYETGIYVLGPNASEEYPYNGANYWQNWEKPIHIEMFETNGDKAFSIDAGVKIHGGWSRTHPQKSLGIFARGKYGQKEINYKIFPNLKYDKFTSFILRTSGSDWDASMIRDGVMDKLVKKTSLDFQAFRPSIVFLNGEYWGIHNIREKANEYLVGSHHNIDPQKIDLISQNGIVVEGSDDEYWRLLNFLESNDLTINENYEKLKTLIDLDNFIEYYAAEIYFDNTDWPGNNIKMWREQVDSAKWRMILYDTDFGFGLMSETYGYSHNTLEFATTTTGDDWPNPPWSTFILRKLLENDKSKNKFINQFSRYFNTSFSIENVNKVINKFQEQIESEMPRHIEKWKTFTVGQWHDNIGVMHEFNFNRMAFVKEFLKYKFQLGGAAKININNLNPEMGEIFFDGIEIKDSTWQGEYFQDSKVQLVADAKKYYAFSHWTGDLDSNEPIIEVSLSETNNFIAVFELKEDSSEIVINEINYNSNPDYNPQDWIELFNPTDKDIDISGWIFNDSKLDSNFIIPSNTLLKSNDYIVLTEDSTSFKSIFPNVNNFIGDFPFKLNNDGEYITLYNNEELVDSVKYNDKNPWPINPDGNGQTLELINYKLDNNNPENWGRSYFNGTPGKINDRYLKSKITNEISQISLFQNYPNPFNSSTEIAYALATDSKVKIEIFDVLGKRVRLLKEGESKKGFYSVYWDGKNDVAQSVSSGIYFYSVNNTVEIVTKKMIYLK